MIVEILFALLATTINIHAHSQSNYTNQIETQLPNPTTIRFGNELYTISKSKQYLNVNSTSGKSCQLRVDPLNENIQGRLQAQSLNDDKRFLIWGIRKTQATRRYHTVLIVEPIACTYIPIDLPEETKVNSNWPVFPAQIMVTRRNEDFHVFYPTGTICSPCSFWFNGKKKEKSSYYLKNERYVEPSSHFWIDSYTKTSSAYGQYFYAFNFANGTSKLYVLSVLYRTNEKIQFDHPVDAAAINEDSYQNTAICYKSVDKKRVTCERLDRRLKPGFTYELPLSGCDIVSDVSIEVDEVGNTFIGVITNRRLHFFIYDLFGELNADFDFGEVDENYNIHREIKGIRLGKEFCLVAVAFVDIAFKETRHVVKCVDTTKYIG